MKLRKCIQTGLSMTGLAVLGLALVAQPVASAFAATSGSDKAPSSPTVFTYIVNTTSDSGTGSLRDAINMTNSSPGKDKITFHISGTGVRTILPISALPPITDAVELDATTQLGYAGTPIIELNGSSAGWVQAGLMVTGSGRGSTIRGLAINRFNGAGIKIVETGEVTLEGNFIGTNPDGTVAQGNGGPGIYMEWTGNNVIGGTTSSARNLISGNNGHGITLHGVGPWAENNQILGNYIGTNISGTAALGNGGHGVAIQGSHGNAVGKSVAGARNLISGNQGSGVWISGSTYTNKVQGNFIGTDATGTARLGNGVNGVTLRGGAFYNNIGGVGSEGNLISGNLGSGVLITATGQMVENTVSGNYIGTNIDGTAPLSNTINGVSIDNAGGNHIGGFVEGHRNVISGNGEHGVLLFGSSNNNKVQANYIGTNASGTLKLGNKYHGVAVVRGSSNKIGGTTPELRNLISGNGDSGIHISSNQQGTYADNNSIEGNFIGTNATGMAALGNTYAGVTLTSWTRGTMIGGPEAGARNLISGNDYFGIVMWNASNTTIQNNYIGTNVSGTGPLGHLISGINMGESYTSTIGGGVGLGNVIANNEYGIQMGDGRGNAILTNSIYNNSKLGINLMLPTEQTVYVTPNDALDPDDGPNKLQNYPVLDANSTQTQLKGSLNSLPNTTFTIEFFANNSCNASGYGEGKTFVGTTVVTTGANGNASFTFEPNQPVPGGTYLTSTATDPNGNTSEFSACMLIQGPVPTATSTNTTVPSATRTATAIPSATNTATGSNPTATNTVTGPNPTATNTASNPTATATATQTTGGECQVSFTDVPEGSTFYQYVQCLACKGILGGYSDGTFRTNHDVTRGQLSKIVSNAAGFNEPVGGQTFSDVAPDSPFYPYVERMVKRGIIGGYPDGTFRPNNNATRGQISKIVANARSYTEPVGGQTFSDVAPDSPFYAYIERMVSRGIIGGYADGTFRPNANATRGQTAKIVSNAFFPNCQTP